MEKIELQEIIDVCENEKSEYINLYRPLLGYEDEITLYRGVDDSALDVVAEVEAKSQIKFPPDLFQVYLLSNGGKYFDVNLYSLTADKNYTNGIYYQNMTATTREEYAVPENMILIGDTEDGMLILIGIDDEGYYYYSMWDKETKEEETRFDFLVELLIYEIDYHTGAFDIDEEEEEN